MRDIVIMDSQTIVDDWLSSCWNQLSITDHYVFSIFIFDHHESPTFATAQQLLITDNHHNPSSPLKKNLSITDSLDCGP